MNPESTEPSSYRRILFCTDFSENAGYAFTNALDAAVRRPGCILYLLHVLPEPEAQFWKTYIYEVEGVDNKAREDIDRKLSEDYLPKVPSGVDLRVEFKVGKPDQQILEFAREKNVDLIVLGREGHGRMLGRIFFGSVAEKVVRKAECPVLVVPHPTGNVGPRPDKQAPEPDSTEKG
ncbi:MAG: universal stress protein [Kiritimatiellae bacterium]|nr:universal stress protein [Kiritimatiellia bacterium]